MDVLDSDLHHTTIELTNPIDKIHLLTVPIRIVENTLPISLVIHIGPLITVPILIVENIKN